MCPARCAPAHGASPSLDSGLFYHSFPWLFSSGKLMDFPNLVLKVGKICIVISEGEEIFSRLAFEENQGLGSPSHPTPSEQEGMLRPSIQLCVQPVCL